MVEFYANSVISCTIDLLDEFRTEVCIIFAVSKSHSNTKARSSTFMLKICFLSSECFNIKSFSTSGIANDFIPCLNIMNNNSIYLI